MGWKSNISNIENNRKLDKVIYLTYGDHFSGVFKSQAIETCNFLQHQSLANVKLISFVDYTVWFSERKKIKSNYSNSIILPTLCSKLNWHPLFAILFIWIPFFFQVKKVLGRGIISTNVALIWSKFLNLRVVYDGRGAVNAEWNEYNLGFTNLIKQKSFDWEKNCVLNSDFRISVSNKLIEYWGEKYNYYKSDHVIVSCTFSEENLKINLKLQNQKLKEWSFDSNDIIAVFSGGKDPWQSMESLTSIMEKWLINNKNLKIIFLTSPEIKENEIFKKYPDRVFQDWISPKNVFSILKLADYGILIRDENITNKVASPTKFAEYLVAGLKLIISENIGDYSIAVKTNGLGIILNENMNEKSEFLLVKPSLKDKQKSSSFAQEKLSRSSNIDNYKRIVNC